MSHHSFGLHFLCTSDFESFVYILGQNACWYPYSTFKLGFDLLLWDCVRSMFTIYSFTMAPFTRCIVGNIFSRLWAFCPVSFVVKSVSVWCNPICLVSLLSPQVFEWHKEKILNKKFDNTNMKDIFHDGFF